uniref:Ig-like domain-containing protein n=1 Tax=Amazona collaria TaxID=241587 RepID=A0A8B9FEN2_9PSIT
LHPQGVLHFLTQTPRHITAQAGNETQLLCELQREHAGVYWYRWSQEKQNFEFLMFSSPMGKATYGTNMSQKFSAHGAGTRTSYSLRISHLHASDNGIYYCSISQSSQLLLGTGTLLSVGKHHPWSCKMHHCDEQGQGVMHGSGPFPILRCFAGCLLPLLLVLMINQVVCKFLLFKSVIM